MGTAEISCLLTMFHVTFQLEILKTARVLSGLASLPLLSSESIKRYPYPRRLAVVPSSICRSSLMSESEYQFCMHLYVGLRLSRLLLLYM